LRAIAACTLGHIHCRLEVEDEPGRLEQKANLFSFLKHLCT